MMFVKWPWLFAIVATTLGTAIASGQTCSVDVALTAVELWGTTTGAERESRRIDELQLPPAAWGDSLWVRVAVRSRGTNVRLVELFANVQPVVGPVVYTDDRGMRYPDHERSLARGAALPSGVFLRSLRENLPAGDAEVILGPFEIADVFFWGSRPITWHVLPVGVDIRVAAVVFDSPGAQGCFDLPFDNLLGVRVPVLNLR